MYIKESFSAISHRLHSASVQITSSNNKRTVFIRFYLFFVRSLFLRRIFGIIFCAFYEKNIAKISSLKVICAKAVQQLIPTRYLCIIVKIFILGKWKL